MPTYNGNRYLRATINSLLAQTYKNFELIISDDNSTDRTAAICQEFTKKDRRIIFIQQKKRLGFARNFNFVLQKAGTPYFLWAGQDDLWDKNYIKILLQLLESNPDAVSAVSNYQNLFEGKKYTVKKHNFNEQETNNLNRTVNSLLHFIITNNLSYFYGLHKTAVLKRIGGYQIDSRPFFKSSDYLTIFRLLTQGRMVFSHKTLFFKRETGMFTRRFTLLEKRRFTKKVRAAIIRYLSLPLSFVYDALLSIRYMVFSHFSTWQKVVLIVNIAIFYLRRNFEFLLSILQGIWYLIKGIIRSL